MRRDRETTLMLSETSFTTQTSSSVNGATETGSMPTGISAVKIGLSGLETSNTDSRLSGVLTANSFVPSGESRIGLICLPSKLTKLLWPNAAVAIKRQQRTRRAGARFILEQ